MGEKTELIDGSIKSVLFTAEERITDAATLNDSSLVMEDRAVPKRWLYCIIMEYPMEKWMKKQNKMKCDLR